MEVFKISSVFWKDVGGIVVCLVEALKRCIATLVAICGADDSFVFVDEAINCDCVYTWWHAALLWIFQEALGLE